MKVKIKRLKAEAILPTYAHPGDVGLDLYSLEDHTLQPSDRYHFFLGFALEFPEGYAGIIKDKSSLPSHESVHTMAGVFDAGYRGEYNVLLINLSKEPVKISKGQKIAQLILFPVALADFEEVAELNNTARGEGRMGSTGKF